MIENLTERMIRAANDKRYAPHVRMRIQAWIDMSFRCNAWFVEEAKSRYDEEPLLTLLRKDSDAFGMLEAALKAYRSHPKGKNEETLITAIEASIETMLALVPDDWVPKKNRK